MEKDSFRRRFFFFLSEARTAFWAFPAFLTAFPEGAGGILDCGVDVKERVKDQMRVRSNDDNQLLPDAFIAERQEEGRGS